MFKVSAKCLKKMPVVIDFGKDNSSTVQKLVSDIFLVKNHHINSELGIKHGDIYSANSM